MNGEKTPRRLKRRLPSRKILPHFLKYGEAAIGKFESNIDKNIESTTGCWKWTAGKRPDGSGLFKIKDGEKTVTVSAHRIAWTLHYQTDIPQGLLICHTCDNTWCVNWEHLWLGRDQHNVFDAQIKGRRDYIPPKVKEEYAALYIGGMGWTEILKRFNIHSPGCLSHIFNDPIIIRKYGMPAVEYKRKLKAGIIKEPVPETVAPKPPKNKV